MEWAWRDRYKERCLACWTSSHSFVARKAYREPDLVIGAWLSFEEDRVIEFSQCKLRMPFKMWDGYKTYAIRRLQVCGGCGMRSCAF